MENFKEVFNNWINSKTQSQVEVISEICEEVGIDPKSWLTHYINRHGGDCSGTQILTDMGEMFAYYIETKFQDLFLKFLEPRGYNIYKEPYLGLEFDLEIKNKKLYAKKYHKKNFKKMCDKLTLDQKIELSENKLISYVVSQTNLKMFSKKEIRFLKLKKINEYEQI